MTTQFEIGTKYAHTINDHWMFAEVLARTAKTVTIRCGWATIESGYTYKDETEKKIIKVDKDGDEYIVMAFGRYYACNVFVDPAQAEADRKKAIADKMEADRLARVSVQIPEFKDREVESIDQNVLMSWAICNDIANLVKYAKKIKCGDVMICANPEQNFCRKHLYFDNGFQVWVYDGRHDKYTTYFTNGMVAGHRNKFDESFTIKASHSYEHGMTLTPQGVWLRADGSVWEPNWEAMNN